MRKRDRLKTLRNFLYGAGISYILLTITMITLSILNYTVMGTELTILVTVVGSSITTIVGVIAGTSID